ncbi:MAG: DUF58 domain-containing protein [Bacteroidales bacterium]|nr:DUF58 domain-containing protein [Bacteroidales bacterium]
MEASELIKRVRKIEIKTRGLSEHIFAGQYHSAFKGKGMTFSEVREYQYGDDIRNVDWNVTARFNHPYSKIYEEERELTVMLMVDVSGSRDFGSSHQMKKNMMTEIAAVIAFSAIQNNDKVGVILFSDRIEKFIPPKKGRSHMLRIIRELIDFEPVSRSTNLTEPLRYLTNAIKRRSIAFLISDFMGSDFEESIRIAKKKHDVVSVWVYDNRETDLPPVGLIKLKDAETNEEQWVDSSSRFVRDAYRKAWKRKQEDLNELFKKAGVDYVAVATDKDYVKPLISLFKHRY